MRRALSWIVLLNLGLLGGYRIWIAGQSPESKIRAAFGRAEEGFNETELSPVMALLSHDYADETSGFIREDVQAVVVRAFFSELDPETKSFRYRLSFDEVEVEVGEHVADVTTTVHLSELEGGEWREVWAFLLEGEMSEAPDGWALHGTRFQTRTGDVPR